MLFRSAVKGPLNGHGIVFMQTFSPSAPGFLALSTRLLHTSGEWIEDEMTVPLQKNDAQGYGNAATYSRRYALAAITGLYQADDDGQEAVKPQPVAKLRTVSADQITAITNAASEAGIEVAEICKVGKIKSISDLPAEKCANLINWINNNAKAPA